MTKYNLCNISFRLMPKRENMIQLVFDSREQEKYIFRYEYGKEDELLGALIDISKDGRIDFDWFDAAVLSFNLTQFIISRADNLLNSRKAAIEPIEMLLSSIIKNNDVIKEKNYSSFFSSAYWKDLYRNTVGRIF
jgi:hypothetical protein